ncbi:prepilin peptidase [Erwinia psidii]|uniref:Prepilin peptidase n=1 Tax=Erwinia psidii TaxID=69224 RepID=A0A3N6RXR9_9GAMM|nr:A24 family peptidase [Erwinia psidii]MCX8957036.1 prepilin peptidase [Erwinia psidii]MCX8965294.1 prepilin peptidase [Erwinia psidii]RQM37908.1 prepilin peptidase [Erwinia psidii]
MTFMTLSLPWTAVVILFPLCLGIFSFMMHTVRISLTTWDQRISFFSSPTAHAEIRWIYAAVVTVIILAPVPEMDRLLAFFFCLFLFRLSLTDMLTGLLPRELTVRCLIAGFAAALVSTDFTSHLLSAYAALLIFGCWRYLSTRQNGRECLGLGDVWLAGGIGAWLGGVAGLYALLTGVVLFVLWQISVARLREGGPMGPWLSAGAIVMTLIRLYHPLFTW